MRLTLLSRRILTAQDSDSPAYLITLGADQALNYAPGDWIAVQGQNAENLVQQVMELLGLDSAQTITLRRCGEVNVGDALRYHLELTLLDPAILNKLTRQYGYQAWPDRGAMQQYAQGRDIVDLLQAFADLTQLGVEFLQLLSPLAPRYYSIASAPDGHPNEVQLLYKHIHYQRENRWRDGVTSAWMSHLPIGETLEAEIKPNAHFKLPSDGNKPIVMLAAGTGLAPFIGFMQARIAEQAQGANVLFFGETHQATRFLCAEDLLAWQQQGKMQLFTAFSRDQTDKIYVQDRLWQQRQAWLALWQQGAQVYVCGDKTGLAQGVEHTIKRIWQQAFSWDEAQVNQAWLDAKKQGRIQLDIY